VQAGFVIFSELGSEERQTLVVAISKSRTAKARGKRRGREVATSRGTEEMARVRTGAMAASS